MGGARAGLAKGGRRWGWRGAWRLGRCGPRAGRRGQSRRARGGAARRSGGRSTAKAGSCRTAGTAARAPGSTPWCSRACGATVRGACSTPEAGGRTAYTYSAWGPAPQGKGSTQKTNTRSQYVHYGGFRDGTCQAQSRASGVRSSRRSCSAVSSWAAAGRCRGRLPSHARLPKPSRRRPAPTGTG